MTEFTGDQSYPVSRPVKLVCKPSKYSENCWRGGLMHKRSKY